LRAIQDYPAYLFDLDGTLYLGPDLIPGCDVAVRWLQAMGRGVMFLSNKPIATRLDYAEKLTRLGIPAQEEDVLNSSLALARYLAAGDCCVRCYVIGEAPLLDDLISAGLQVVNEPLEATVVVVSWDRDFSYRKLDGALQAVRNGARIVATNPDVACPTTGGGLVPDCGAIAAAVEACTGQAVEMYAGKPSRLLAELAWERLGVAPEDCLMVGDRLETDVAFGRNNGMASALVLTGACTLEMAQRSAAQPDYVLDSVADLLPR
jgi:HAD superfamily hydrolase (TIGR01450 family)